MSSENADQTEERRRGEAAQKAAQEAGRETGWETGREASEKASEEAGGGAKKPGAGKAKRILTIIGAVVLTAGAYWGWSWWSHGRFFETSDDAYLQADLITLLARENGYIDDIAVEENAPVEKGQLIARIDPGDYELALRSAQNALASAKSAVSRIDAQIAAAEAAVAQREAALASAEATRDGAKSAHDRAVNLRATSAGSQASVDDTKASWLSSEAGVKSAEAALAQAHAEIAVLKAQRDEAALQVASAETGVAKAERNLSFTEIRAPFSGVLTRREIEIGSYVATGGRIGTLVPLDKVYAEVNFKETQISGVRPGAEAVLTVDAWPDQVLHGRVASLAAGAGQVFSLLPPQNATGNFTKVVQRVPVRIEIAPEDRAKLPLRPGMSVVVEVDTRTGEAAQPAAADHGSEGRPSAGEPAARAGAGVTEG